jgi:hypothetical protein
MSKKKSPINRLREYSKSPRRIADIWAVENEYSYGTSDRAMAILMSAMVEDHLESFLLFHMNDALTPDDEQRLSGQDGLLTNFASKIMLGFAFNLFGATTRHDLDLVRHLRNQFAHTTRPLDFTLREVSDVCADLKFCDLDGVEVSTTYILQAPNYQEAKSMQNARTRYYTTCHEISSRMMRVYLGPSDLSGPLPPGPLLP